jgi:hypothetical protein
VIWAWYRDNDAALDASLPLGKQRDNVALLERYYPVEIVSAGKGGPDVRIAYEHFINRMGFWMATARTTAQFACCWGRAAFTRDGTRTGPT